uniref:Putative maltase glucoamylase n=1 Tax=Nyssomyia neivai TaxID=330878 RepID=A0A1L8DQS6_9DIPT
MVRCKIYFLISLLVVGYSDAAKVDIGSRSANIRISVETDECVGIGFSVVRDGQIVYESSLGHTGKISSMIENGDSELILMSNQEKIVLKIVEDTREFFQFDVSRKSIKSDKEIVDCVSLGGNELRWYGGPQQKYQYWPVEKLTLSNYSYITKEADSCAIAERYWLNSEGVFIHLSDRAPLFIDQNSRKDNHLCFITKLILPYNTRAQTFDFEYTIGVASDPRKAHLEAVHRVLGKPSGVPDELMAARPIWSTWARYKRDINESVVLEFAKEIIDNKFTNSQFEIDDDWEICYGALTFRESKFPDIKKTVQDLKSMGFRVTLWIHPFVNKGCDPWYKEGVDNGYFVLDHNGKEDTQWWNSKTGEAAYVDFTKPEASNWYISRLSKLLEDTGIDSYKFDAGEASWQPDDPILSSTSDQHPLKIQTDYIREVATFGPIVEVRSGFRNQFQQIYMRMIDKDSLWSWNNGLPTLVTTLMQLNMNGYPLVLPDMIGGNGYEGAPSREMFIRWLQANVFMASMQFSYVPWDYTDGDGINILELCRHFVQLHEDFIDVIVERFHRAVDHGEPVNPPVWWIDPKNHVAHTIYDEFLLGEEVLAAPVLEEGQTSRDIYLPAGDWLDGNNGSIYTGPLWLRKYPAPLSVLPYFIRQKK